MRITEIGLRATAEVVPELNRFYRSLGLRWDDRRDHLEFRVGETQVRFAPSSGPEAPFYHFAIRVPRNRFEPAAAWLEQRTELLPHPGTTNTKFEFASWNATACYAHDPAGNIIELIAHHELPEETAGDKPFDAGELLAVCEIGLVGDDTETMAGALSAAGIPLWDGSLEPGKLAFMGGREGVLILTPAGRGWMPTGRPARPHPVDVVVEGRDDVDLEVPSSPHKILIRRR